MPGTPRGLNGDGSVLVGDALGPDGARPILWEAKSDAEDLGLLPGDRHGGALAVPERVTHSEVIGISGGDIVLGKADERGFVWTQGNGFAYLDEVLERAGIRTGPELTVFVLSGDGAFVAGTREDSFSHVEHAFLVALPERW